MMDAGDQLKLPFERILPLLTVDEIYERASSDLLRTFSKEDRRFERKPSGVHTLALGDYFSMWANTAPDGGIIVIGMEDDCAISGCRKRSADQMNRIESTRIDYCPDSRAESKRIAVVNDLDGQEDYLPVFRVFYRPDKIVRTTSGNAYWRVADKRKRLTEKRFGSFRLTREKWISSWNRLGFNIRKTSVRT